MSNQVYANSSQKYFTYPGFNKYTLSENQQLNPGSPYDAAFVNSVLVNQPSIITLSNGVFTIQETGIYSITAVMTVLPSNPNTVWELASYLFLITSDARNDTAVATDSTSTEQYSLNYIGWLQAGDAFKITLTNVGNQNISVSTSSLAIVARIV